MKKAQYPSYLHSVHYSAQKEDVSDFMKVVSKGNKMQSIKYRSELVQKYDEKHRSRLTKVFVYHENSQMNCLNIKNNPLNFKDQTSLNPLTSSNTLNKQNASINFEDQAKDAIFNPMMLAMCNNMQETNRRSYTSNTSETVGIQQIPNILEGKLKKNFNISDLKGQLPCHNDNNSQASDDTHDENGQEYFTPGDNKIKIRKLNNNFLNNNLNTSNNNITFPIINNTNQIHEFKNQDSKLYAQNNIMNANQLFKLNEVVSTGNFITKNEVDTQQLPLDLSNYQKLLSQLSSQQLSQQQSNPSVSNSSYSTQTQLLPLNLQSVNLNDMLLNTQQNQIFKQNNQQILASNGNQNNNLLSLLQNSGFNQENLQLNNNTFSLLSNINNSGLQQTEQQQNLLGKLQFSQLQQQNQLSKQIDQQLLIQQLLQQQQQQNMNSYQTFTNDNLNQMNLINQVINQNSNANLNIKGISDLLYPQQNQQNSIALQQNFLNQQQLQQTPLIQQQLIKNNTMNTQLDNQRITDMFQQMIMQQYQ